ncbi:MAG: hypothetical protein A2Z21_02710 [Candidatus Fraserbacteria bacterium RBG_16_55_9]|uniref:Nickel/cobalt efflux system n=1 Tax=Fraserbacteria sp. (strain RBG_16_55_9) TaxID=1817864 RepID=A0A1F5V2I0_FRAXR|nr:MAG: hypothetical protein A2Z21_02710 [Candidatus Fraserbacteria bacterium RBG_16_55_9]
MAVEQLWALLSLGFLLGLRHALDADHVVAVSAIVAQTRQLTKAALVGVLWGVGHTFTLSIMGLLVLFGKLSISSSLAQAAEFLVGFMLILLGISTLWTLRRQRIHLHRHSHGAEEHIHFHGHAGAREHTHEHPEWSWKPLVVGMIHGLAGSAALMLLVLGTVRSELAGLLYILVFGAGSIGGMLLVSFLLGLPVVWAAHAPALQRAHRAIALTAGLASIVFGLWMMLEIGTLEGWLGP